MDIIPHILTEEMVEDLQDEHLALLASSTTERLMKFIHTYLNKKDGVKQEVQDRIRDAYDYTIKRDKFLAAEQTSVYSELLLNTEYSMLSVAMPVEQIDELIAAIDYITTSKYAVPYISSITASNCNSLKKALIDYIGGESHPEASKFLKKVMKYNNLFKDGNAEFNTGTVVKKIVRNLQTYEIMRRGLCFIRETKLAQRTYQSWRFL